jgi:hypothetical protein
MKNVENIVQLPSIFDFKSGKAVKGPTFGFGN